ncbi:Fic family protein [Cryobacterium sp. Y29]|uniref:Fic family protein n=1 Tax=Cryobacterium sp. Y29 TaxID=2048285 RepID=UPI000CE46271|nr:Fic family protein [Cryobacterium sp. Y29]
MTGSVWPAHTTVVVPFKSSLMSGPTEIAASLPPKIARLTYSPSRASAQVLADAAEAITALDSRAGRVLSQFLARSESIASAKIEDIEVSTEDYARGLGGIAASESAVAIVNSACALQLMVDSASDGVITLESLLAGHRTLMASDRVHGRYAGEFRTMQSWIGGSYSPRNAVYVPPPAAVAPSYMDDLLDFVNRDDIPVLAQAAIAHAQFVSIHPFTDGNGRVGRALINAIIRRRGLTTRTVLPISATMAARPQAYFDLLSRCRESHVDEFVMNVARSAQVVCNAAAVSVTQMNELPQYWATLSQPRAGSTAARILAMLLSDPVLTVHSAARLSGLSLGNARNALNRLEADTVIEEITSRKHGRVWVSPDVLEEQDSFTRRVAETAISDF